MKEFYSLDKFKKYVEETVEFMLYFFEDSDFVGRLKVSDHRIYYRISSINGVTCPIERFSGPSDDELRRWAEGIGVPFSAS